jgi:hypothetical protein
MPLWLIKRRDKAMDIAALSVSMHMADLQNDVGVAMLSKSLDTLEDTGDGMVKMMESSVTPYLGQNIDVSV